VTNQQQTEHRQALPAACCYRVRPGDNVAGVCVVFHGRISAQTADEVFTIYDWLPASGSTPAYELQISWSTRLCIYEVYADTYLRESRACSCHSLCTLVYVPDQAHNYKRTLQIRMVWRVWKEKGPICYSTHDDHNTTYYPAPTSTKKQKVKEKPLLPSYF